MDQVQQGNAVLKLSERRDGHSGRILGHLVSIDGTRAVIATRLGGVDNTASWTIGHLITIVQRDARLVGVVIEISSANRDWTEGEINVAHVRIELSGEILDDKNGQPTFSRGISNYPELGAVAHRIRSRDLASIYAFRGKSGVEIGTLSQASSIPAVINVEDMLTRHFAVIGSTGVGKTTSVSILLHKCIEERENLRILILDPHNEYSAQFGEQCVVLDADTLEIPYWMFRYEEMMEIIFPGRKPSPDEADALHDLIKSAKARFVSGAPGAPPSPATAAAQAAAANALRRSSAPTVEPGGNISADTPSPYRIADALKIIDEWIGLLEKKYTVTDLRTLKNRFEALARDPRYRFMFSKGIVDDNMARVLTKIFRVPHEDKRVTIVQLAGLPNEVVNSVVSVLARLSFEVCLWSGGGIEVALVCEEAHRYIPNERSTGFGPTRQAIGRIAKEGRKYGSCLAVVSQRPSELDPTVLSQCSTMFAMRLPNEADKAIVRGALAESSGSIVSFLSSLANREAIAFGEAIPTPMRLRFGDAPKRMTVAEQRTIAPPISQTGINKVIARLRGEVAGEM